MATTQKISVTIDTADLKWMKRRAKSLGGNLSAVFSEAARSLRQLEARRAVLKRLGKSAVVSASDAAKIRAEWGA